VTSSNTALVSAGGIVLGGSGANRTLTLTPAANASGSTVITVSVSDGGNTASTSFTRNVSPVNDAPTITLPTLAPLQEDVPLDFDAAHAIRIGDVDGGSV
jgi:hypothetical protein